jgi:hypothetical protein
VELAGVTASCAPEAAAPQITVIQPNNIERAIARLAAAEIWQTGKSYRQEQRITLCAGVISLLTQLSLQVAVANQRHRQEIQLL